MEPLNKDLDLTDMRFFCLLCHQPSLTVTAQKMGLSTSAASRILARLRAAFDDPLFMRCREGLSPTSRAVQVLPQVERFIESYDALFRPVHFDPSTASRKIRIACADNGAWEILGTVIPLILERSPELDFDIFPIEDGLVSRLRSGEVDFGIYPTDKTAPGIRSAVIFESTYRYVVRRGHPLETLYNVEKTLSLEDLARYRFISAVISPGIGIDMSPLNEMREANMPGRVQVQTSFILAQPNIIARTDLVGMMPESGIRRLIASGVPIVPLCPIFMNAHHRPHLLWHERSDADPLTTWIRALFVHAFRGESAQAHHNK